MTLWLPAAPGHERYLKQFVCTQPITERNHFGKPVASDPWSHTVQKLVRGIRVKDIRSPRRVDLVFNADKQRIDAVICYDIYWEEPTVLRVDVHLIATHVSCQGNGLGKEMLRRLETVALAEASSRPATDVLLNAQVHVSNEPCRALIVDRGWLPIEMTDDEEYESWGTSLELQNDAHVESVKSGSPEAATGEIPNEPSL